MSGNRKRHCWECRRRALVCDFAVPGCSRCAAAGIDCPGYGETAPPRIRWLMPGQVNSRLKGASRSRSRNGKAGIKKGSPEASKEGLTSITSTESLAPTQRLASSESLASAEHAQRLMVPRLELKTEAHAQMESFDYFNSCIYPRLAQVLRLGSSVNIYPISMPLFQVGLQVPDHIRLGLICSTLSHRMSQTTDDPGSKTLAQTFYHYRGLMIRSLNDDLGNAQKQTSNIVLVGILTLLFADVQRGIPQSWRYHTEAVRRLIVARGGMYSMAAAQSVLLPVILCFAFLVVTADTYSPASDLLMDGLPLEELYVLLEQHGDNGYVFQMCPPPLFVEIAKINYLRSRASKANAIGDDHQKEACGILQRVYAFSPAAWTEATGPPEDDRTLFFEIMQRAVALFYILSLQSVHILPGGSQQSMARDRERETLYHLLVTAFDSSFSLGMKGYLLWPIMVLGVAAVHGGAVMRSFVRRSLVDLSVSRGTSSPLVAKQVLETFWDSGKTEWDECFDAPHLFTAVLTVNRRRTPPPSLGPRLPTQAPEVMSR